jgi:hypothetical protein
MSGLISSAKRRTVSIKVAVRGENRGLSPPLPESSKPITIDRSRVCCFRCNSDPCYFSSCWLVTPGRSIFITTRTFFFLFVRTLLLLLDDHWTPIDLNIRMAARHARWPIYLFLFACLQTSKRSGRSNRPPRLAQGRARPETARQARRSYKSADLSASS